MPGRKVKKPGFKADSETGFAAWAAALTDSVAPLLVQVFGRRCKDFDPDCECCKRWAALDVLTDNPFKD